MSRRYGQKRGKPMNGVLLTPPLRTGLSGICRKSPNIILSALVRFTLKDLRESVVKNYRKQGKHPLKTYSRKTIPVIPS